MTRPGPAIQAPAATQAQLAAATPKMREAARSFETQVLSQLLQPAFAGLGTDATAAGGGGAAEAQWRPMLVDAMAGAASRAGHGLGIADLVLREMLRRQSADGAAAAQAKTATDHPEKDPR
jgi:peptidoglycan hydrolase FlgJ